MDRGSEGLISVQTPAIKGITFIETLLQRLPGEVHIKKSSSVYQTNFSKKNVTESLLVCVLKYETNLSAEEIGARLKPHEEWILLLTYNVLVALDPRYPLPHPAMYENKTILRCAAEVWGTYRHPVLGQLLNELVGSDTSGEDMRFFSQGRVLI